MRIHASREILAFLRKPETPAGVRRAIEALLHNPYPEGVRKIEDRPGYYEIFQSGLWITYMVDRTGAEIVIRLANIEEN